MPDGIPADLTPHLEHLLQLAASNYEMAEVTELAESAGWEVADSSEADCSIWLELSEDLTLCVSTVGGEEGAMGWLPVYWHNPPEGLGNAALTTGRANFDTAFDRAKAAMITRLGEPAEHGEYPIHHRKGISYRFATWRVEGGAMVLQQDEIDLTCGFDVSLWIIPLAADEALPVLPLHT